MEMLIPTSGTLMSLIQYRRLAGKMLLSSVALLPDCAVRTVRGSAYSGVRPFFPVGT